MDGVLKVPLTLTGTKLPLLAPSNLLKQKLLYVENNRQCFDAPVTFPYITMVSTISKTSENR